MKNWTLFFTLFIATLCLQGCVPLVIIGAGAATAAAIVVLNDHRSSPTKNADQRIQATIIDELQLNEAIRENCHIIVTVFAGNVLLTGQAPTMTLKNKAERIAASVPGILRLYNEVDIAAPNSQLNRVSDYWITTKINTLLLRDKALETAQIQVLTENGIVYLLGTATHTQTSIIIEKIREISGVQKIVKMLNYNAASIS